MRKQYQGQLSASMLYILLCRTGFMTGSFFVYEGLFFIRKTKNTAIACDVNLKMVNLSRVPANIKFKIYATHFDAIFAFYKKKNKKKSI
jgi:hypothetical protein